MKKRDTVDRVVGEAGIGSRQPKPGRGHVRVDGGGTCARRGCRLHRLGRFSGRTGRPAGRNPRTGERVAGRPSARVSLRAGKTFKDALN